MNFKVGPNSWIVLLMVLGCWALQAIIAPQRKVRPDMGTRLMSAISQDSVHELAAAIGEGGGSWELRDDRDRTLLMQAAASGKVRVLRLLLQHRVDIEATDRNRRTALFYAAAYDHPQVIRLLLDAGADADHRDDQAMTALDEARSCESRGALHVLQAAEPCGAAADRAN